MSDVEAFGASLGGTIRAINNFSLFQGESGYLMLYLGMCNIIAPTKKDFGSGTRFWLAFSNVDGLTVNGDVDGNGSSWWSSCENGNGCGFYEWQVLKFDGCNNLQVSGLRITNASRNHISMANCADATISNINIITPNITPNIDGIDVSLYPPGLKFKIPSSKRVMIALLSTLAAPTSTLLVIGSLGEGGSKGTVEEVHVVNCTFFRTKNAARMTWQKISFKNITPESMNPILIDQYYCDDMEHCKNQTLAVEISDISFIGFTGTSATGAAVQLLCSESVGCHRLVLDGINITASPNLTAGGKDGDISSKCINAHGTSSASNMPSVPCLLPNDDDELLHD
ncbi:probable polygalacturonase At1g80170 [Rhododendron vialii]|uniref:probable polygalacturonase At1g80170 n=1 Tax=Rhododendron vialii TaxID=182163 RepID=UPI00265DCC5E|nr:probable polygalacturonase At1g80170 [Rhododendron vialii]